MTTVSSPASSMSRQGNYAGAASRLAAFAIDVGASWGLYTLAAALLAFASQLILSKKLTVSGHQIAGVSILVIWEFVYFAYQWALSGRTVGMALVGIQVVRRDGGPINGRRAVIRTVAFPLGFLTLGIGFLGIVIGRERRAVYDRIAGTAVVYSWDARAARLRWLARQEQPGGREPAKPTGPP